MEFPCWMSRSPAAPAVAEAGALTLFGGGQRDAFEIGGTEFCADRESKPCAVSFEAWQLLLRSLQRLAEVLDPEARNYWSRFQHLFQGELAT